MRLRRGIGLFISAASVASATSVAGLPYSRDARAESVVVPLPCNASTAAKPALRACKDVVEGAPGKPGVIDLLKTRMKTQIEGNDKVGGYYQNVDPDAAQPPVSAALAPRGKGTRGNYFGPAVCNLVPGELVPVMETRADHTADHKSCGLPTDLKFKVDSSPTSYQVIPTFVTGWHPDASKSPGSLEDGYIKGALVAATQCFYASMKNEIQARKQITVDDVAGHPSPCLPLAKDAQHLIQQFDQDLASLAKAPNAPKNLADIVNCEKTGLDPLATQIGSKPELMGLRQSAQHLCAARAALEGLVVELAACQVFAQSGASWTRALREKEGVDAFAAHLRREVAQPCHDACDKKLRAEFSVTNRPSAEDIRTCANACYRGDLPRPGGKDDGRLVPAFRKYFEDLWPAQPGPGKGCRFGSLPLGFLFVGSLGRPGVRRRRTGRPNRARLAATLLAWALVALKLAACGDDAAAPNFPVPNSPDQSLCNPNETYADAESKAAADSARASICPPKTPGQGGANQALEQGAAMASAGEAGMNNARRLEDPMGGDEVKTGGPLAQGAAASDGVGLPKAPGLANTAGPSADPVKKSAPAPKGGAGGGGLSGSGAGSGGMGGELKTSVAALPEGGALSAPGEAAGSAYQATGHGAAAGGGGAEAYVPRGLNFGGGEGATNGEVAVGADAGAMAVATLGSEDPEDYFTRTGLDDNLFKKVEKVYRTKSMNWASTDVGLKRASPIK